MLALLLACSSTSVVDDPTPGADTGDTAPDVDTADTADTADTGDTGPDPDQLSGRYSTDDADFVIVPPVAPADLGRLIVPADLDGDGAIDLAMNTMSRDSGQGGAWLLYGPLGPDLPLRDTVIVAERGDSYVGRSLAVGDLTGDGVPDVALGRAYANAAELTFTGPFSADRTTSAPDSAFTGAPYGDLSGHAAGVADLDGDGQDDLVVSAYGAQGAAINGGVVYFLAGPITAGSASLASVADASVAGEISDGGFGRQLHVGGDLDGDGLPDVLIAQTYAKGEAPGSGVVHVVLGPWSGKRTTADLDARLLGELPNQAVGEAMTAGDLDHDGHDEAVIAGLGLPATRQPGKVYALPGPFAGDMALADAPTQLEGDTEGGALGASLCVEDLDGDGALDLAVGAMGEATAGVAWLYYGPVAGPITELDATAQFRALDPYVQFGSGLAMADVDADGAKELLVGANADQSSGPGAGAIYVFGR